MKNASALVARSSRGLNYQFRAPRYQSEVLRRALVSRTVTKTPMSIVVSSSLILADLPRDARFVLKAVRPLRWTSPWRFESWGAT